MMRQLDDAIFRRAWMRTFSVIVLRGRGRKNFSVPAQISACSPRSTPEFKYYFCLHANETLNRLEQTPNSLLPH